MSKLMLDNTLEEDFFKKAYELNPENETFFLFYLLALSKMIRKAKSN